MFINRLVFIIKIAVISTETTLKNKKLVNELRSKSLAGFI